MFGNRKPVTKEEQVLQALGTVQEPELHNDLVSLGMIEELVVDGSRVSFTVVLTTPACPLKTQIEQESREAVLALPGIDDVAVNFTSRVRQARPREKMMIPGIKSVIAVGSGKGGVGKSTVSVGLALALEQAGAKVGLMDADIWGPNIPQMLGVQTPPQQGPEKIIPAVSYGVKMVSTAFFISEQTPVIWRGPMVGKMVEQLLSSVEWGELDYLIVDLPPGTGDASLTLAQKIPLSGLVLVATPQEVALADASRALAMFRQLKVPIIGIVENMSYFVCPGCDQRHDLFGHGGAALMAIKQGIDLLGEIPLDPSIRVGGDIGQPILVKEPSSPQSAAFREIAGRVAAKVSVMTFEHEGAAAR